jgi:hypothetical protein
VWQAEVVGLAGAHAPRHARTLLRLFRRLGLRVALSAFDVLQVEVEVPGLKPRVLEADAVAEAGEEGAGGVLLSSVAVPFPARGRGYRGAPPPRNPDTQPPASSATAPCPVYLILIKEKSV